MLQKYLQITHIEDAHADIGDLNTPLVAYSNPSFYQLNLFGFYVYFFLG